MSLSATAVDFGNQALNTASQVQTITLTNSGAGVLNVQSVQMTGAVIDFLETTNTSCPASMTAGQSCAITVVFKPTAIGPRTATLTFVDDAAGSRTPWR